VVLSSAQGKEGRPVETSQLLKGVLDLAVLAVLRHDDGYGYDVVRRLRQAGLEEVGDASVYGTLRRLYKAGLLTTYVVASEEGPHRKYYGLNELGRERLAGSTTTWRTFAATMERLLGENS
jgi:PadR family transcriptional regulator PadR